MLTPQLPVARREGTGTKVVYGDNRRWLPLDHAFRTDRDFGRHERLSAPDLRTNEELRHDADVVSAARERFHAKPRSVHDPARESGVSGKSELLRDESFHPVFQWPSDFMHILALRCVALRLR